MNINDTLDKAYESMRLAELVNAPIAALQGVSDSMAGSLQSMSDGLVSMLNSASSTLSSSPSGGGGAGGGMS